MSRLHWPTRAWTINMRRSRRRRAPSRYPEISDLDRQDLSDSYSLAYSQRLGLFNWCHNVIWDYLEAIGDHEAQRQLFVHSSFFWRLSGNAENELKYTRLLTTRNAPPATEV